MKNEFQLINNFVYIVNVKTSNKNVYFLLDRKKLQQFTLLNDMFYDNDETD